MFVTILRFLGIGLAVIVGALVVGGLLFLNLHPQFGGSPTEEQLAIYSRSPQFSEGRFRMEYALSDNVWAGMKEGFSASPKRPDRRIKANPIDSLSLVLKESGPARVTWMGHSAFLVQMDQLLILLDPMLSNNTSPVPFSSSERFSELPIERTQLPAIDVVVFSHDHYDHLDYETVVELKERVGTFIVPLGLSAHLLSWGVGPETIIELDWWEKTTIEGVTFTAAPAQHFSGRGVLDRAATLWCSWVIKGSSNLYFSGDGGYSSHFSDIGERLGPFDLALLECGQYNDNWSSIHMTPEETALAARDLKSELFVPIHWGSFQLAFHDWTDPIERVVKKANELKLTIATPRIGETIIPGASQPFTDWWKDY